MAISKGNWKVGKTGGTVVTDDPEGFENTTGHIDFEYYGGCLIAESIAKNDDAKLIATAPLLLKYLQEAIESMELETNNVPKEWIEAIKKATE